ncbi:MAG: AAA domain-containing protein [Candidatus Gastranaerophilales bacterium]|nr:AAA domain-containing protein [Candidatus Gastranaerophilales bacterium]
MNSIFQDIFRAIHEGKWLKIEYRNREKQTTSYWIGIRGINPIKRTMAVDGLHLSRYTTDSYKYIYMDSILSSQIVEGTYYPVNQQLVQDIYLNPHKYKSLFDNVANLKILNYLEMCNRMDCTPYHSDFALIHFLDESSFDDRNYPLSEEQFQAIVNHFQIKMKNKMRPGGKLKLQQLGMNVLSIHTSKGLYVLAYRKLQLDVKEKVLRSSEEITICTEFAFGEEKESIRKYLDADEYDLLKHFEENQEKIKDCITNHAKQGIRVDDMPYMIGLGMDVAVDLHSEYQAIIRMYDEDAVTTPIKAFFGDLLNRPLRRKEYPISLINHKINLDQLLAIQHAMKYPLAYIQGPPGTGKTNTIINTITTAFFNERTVLFVSYNNHPINGVFQKLSNLEYRGQKIPFPVLRLGNVDKVDEAIAYIGAIYQQVQGIKVFESTLDKKKDDQAERARRLSELLKKYEDILDWKERQEALTQMMEFQERTSMSMQMLPFQVDLQGRQLRQVQQKIDEAGEVTDKEAFALLDDDLDDVLKYLYYTSARYIKKLEKPQYEDLRYILFEESKDTRVASFEKYLSDSKNIKKLQRLFPIIITTCISAHKLGKPEPLFDMTIMDEASQCNTAVSLIPIIRGENLMLVGDPQQLNPVILLDEMTNERLRKKYHVADEYDYRKNSIYKTFLACDAVSDEVLLRNHYRCNKKIIDFNNKKYYNAQLRICSSNEEKQPLVYMDVRNEKHVLKNTAPAEVDAIMRYAALYKEKSIGVITPFVNQRKMIEKAIREEHLQNITCGTVHAFQGDEKDIVLFSTAITDQTQAGTYEWLKSNKELINVATSRARERLIVLADSQNLSRLHQNGGEDDLYELVEYVKRNGQTEVTQQQAHSRALGVKPFSTATEEAFLENLKHALECIWLSQSRYTVHKEVAISQVFQNNVSYNDLFYSGRFDFVVYEKQGDMDIPVLAIELDGKEHFEDDIVMQRDKKKNQICKDHNLQLIRVENSYARRYHHIKEILLSYFSYQH